jgi:hypothetical protein
VAPPSSHHRTGKEFGRLAPSHGLFGEDAPE